MSCEFAVWYPHVKYSNEKAGEIYEKLCGDDKNCVRSDPALKHFYDELTELHPELDSVPPSRQNDKDFCPWTTALEHSTRHVFVSCVWSKADYVRELILKLARKHGLAIYDPKQKTITYPDGKRGNTPKFK